jgi:hypothetical protein
MTTVALQDRSADPPEIGVGEIADELLGLAGGIGFFAVAFLFPIPGLVAALALVVLAGLLVAIPLLAAGIVLALVGGPIWLAARLVRAVRARRS